MASTRARIGAALTDGDGIGTFDLTKLVKDFVADALIGAAAALATINVVAIPTDKAQAITAGLAIGGAVIHAAYRAILKWTCS